MSNAVLERLLLARDRLEKGWCQGSFAANNHYCIVGSITNIKDTNIFNKDAWDETYKDTCMVLLKHNRNVNIIDWNDAPERTKEEVIALMDRVISDYTKELIGVQECPTGERSESTLELELTSG